MRSASVITILLALAGCADEGSVAEDPVTGTSAETLDPDVCVPGWESCPCYQDTCISGLECLSGFCVAVPEPQESSSATTPSSDETDPSDASSESSASSSSGGAGESSSESSSSSSEGPAPVCVEGDSYCSNGDELQTCENGQWQFHWCDEWCPTIGLGGEDCLDSDVCACSGFNDPTCIEAVDWYCICHDEDGYCPIEDRTVWYSACFVDADPVLTCWGAIGIETAEQCAAVIATCES